MTEAALERIIERLLDILEQHLADDERDGIDAVLTGFDVSRDDED